MAERETTEARIQQIGRDIFARALRATPTVLHPEWWHERILEWAMRDAALRVQLFRFVDVLPSLRTGREVAAHLQEYLRPDGDRPPPAPLALALRFGAPGSLGGRVAAFAARRNVRTLARRFIAGETVAEALGTVERLRAQGMSFTVDVLGEATTSDAGADRYAAQYTHLIEQLAEGTRAWAWDERLDRGPGGATPRVNVSLKLSSLDPHFDAMAPARSAAAVAQRLRPILRLARSVAAFVNVDMEQYAYKDLVLDLFESVLLEEELRGVHDVGIVIQTYLPDAPRDLERLLQWVRQRGVPITVRLVKGAYWDYETIAAAQRGWPCPVFTDKHATDASFERCCAFLFDHHTWLRPAIASHSVRSLSAAIVLAEQRGLTPRDFEIQMLFGMGDPLKAALVEHGMHVRVYTPYGPLIPGMAYLIRRLLENTANDSFLRQSFTEHAPLMELLANPAEAGTGLPADPGRSPANAGGMRAIEGWGRGGEFINEPPTDFSRAANRTAFAAALRSVRADADGAYPLIIGGADETSAETLVSVDPSQPDFVVGRVACATAAHADAAVAAARAAWPAWSARAVEERAAVLRRLAAHMRQRRFELAAWIVMESGKPWREADADVAEAIDYCELYARDALRLQGEAHVYDVPGETDRLVYAPRGVAAIIAPWNFPLAILTGMTVAALVTGNTAVVKPAEQSPVIAAKLFEMLGAAGVPSGVANFLPGRGEEVGAHLVNHPHIDIIAFTGSRHVGLQILTAAARVVPPACTVKRVIAEMGGKNAIIVDSDADLDEAVRGVIVSAFGYAGQKCSACARVIVLAAVRDAFIARLVEATTSLPIGAPDDPATVVGPLIDAEAHDRVRTAIAQGKRDAVVLCEVPVTCLTGYFVGPVVFECPSPHIALAQEEIFGPVLAVLTARDLDEALALANDTLYGLTGGVYSRSPAHVARVAREVRVGNLYINRPITGARVGRQPFGGIKLSGIGSKAGGPDYLLQFCEPRTVSENTLRHGFAPRIS